VGSLAHTLMTREVDLVYGSTSAVRYGFREAALVETEPISSLMTRHIYLMSKKRIMVQREGLGDARPRTRIIEI